MLCIYRFQFPEMFKLDLYFFEHSKRSTLCLIIPLSDACGICFCCLLFLLGFVHSVIFPVCGSSLNVCWTFTSPQLPFLQPSQKNLRVKDINSSRVPTLFPSGFHLTLIFKVLLGNYSERSENVTHSYKYLTPPPPHTHTYQPRNVLKCAGAREWESHRGLFQEMSILLHHKLTKPRAHLRVQHHILCIHSQRRFQLSMPGARQAWEQTWGIRDHKLANWHRCIPFVNVFRSSICLSF